MGVSTETTQRGVAFENGEFEQNFLFRPSGGENDKTRCNGEVSRGQLEWLIDLAMDERDSESRSRAVSLIKFFHEKSLGVGSLGEIVYNSGRRCATAAVEGLPLGENQRLEIVYDNEHGLLGCTGRTTYGLLWTENSDESHWAVILELSDLRGKIL